MYKNLEKYRLVWIYLALAAATIAVYWQLSAFEFVNLDDDEYVIENRHVNRGLTGESILWAFCEDHAGNWHPLTSLSHILDCQLYGLNPGRHHLTNLILHAANTLLLFAVLKAMTSAIWRSAFVAAAFALHPLHVESVAWISERKDVLSTLFWFLTMAAYLRYVRRPSKGPYLLTVLVFALGLMAKPMVVTLPFVLLLLDYWPLGRFGAGTVGQSSDRYNGQSVPGGFNWRAFYPLVVEKIPFFALSAGLSVVTFLVERSAGTVATSTTLPIAGRVANAAVSYIRYIQKTVWPVRLAAFYPYAGNKLPVWQILPAAMLLLVITAAVIRLARGHRYMPVGWFWYLGTLIPVIGLVQVGKQSMADRYSYIPLTGLLIIISWGPAELLARWKHRKIVLSVTGAAILAALAICNYRQVGHWRNSITLFEHTLAVTEGNYVAHCNLSSALIEQHNLDEAIAHYRQALRIKPDCAEANNGLGYVYVLKHNFDEAIAYLKKALESKPDFVKAHYNLGNAFQWQGKLDAAISHYEQALRSDPDFAEVHNNLGYALIRQRKFEQASYQLRKAVEIDPEYPTACYNLGNALQGQGKLDEALIYYRRALKLRRDFADAHYNMAIALGKVDKLDEAISHLIEALRIKPDFPEARNALGSMFARTAKRDNPTQGSRKESEGPEQEQ